MADGRRRRGKLLPGLAIGAVILVGTIGLIRGCGYAADEPDYQNSANGVREDPNV